MVLRCTLPSVRVVCKLAKRLPVSHKHRGKGDGKVSLRLVREDSSGRG